MKDEELSSWSGCLICQLLVSGTLKIHGLKRLIVIDVHCNKSLLNVFRNKASSTCPNFLFNTAIVSTRHLMTTF